MRKPVCFVNRKNRCSQNFLLYFVEEDHNIEGYNSFVDLINENQGSTRHEERSGGQRLHNQYLVIVTLYGRANWC